VTSGKQLPIFKKNVATLSLGSNSPRNLLGLKIKSLGSSETSVTTSQSTRLTCQRTQVFICTFAVGADDLKSPTQSTWYSLCCNPNGTSTENNQSTRGTCNRRNLKRRDWDYLGHRDVGMHFKQGLCGQDSSGEGYCPMSDICEHGNEPSDSKFIGEFLKVCVRISACQEGHHSTKLQNDVFDLLIHLLRIWKSQRLSLIPDIDYPD
jgi:hypothetical protein